MGNVCFESCCHIPSSEFFLSIISSKLFDLVTLNAMTRQAISVGRHGVPVAAAWLGKRDWITRAAVLSNT